MYFSGQMGDNESGAYSEPPKEEEDIVKVTNAICNVLKEQFYAYKYVVSEKEKEEKKKRREEKRVIEEEEKRKQGIVIEEDEKRKQGIVIEEEEEEPNTNKVDNDFINKIKTLVRDNINQLLEFAIKFREIKFRENKKIFYDPNEMEIHLLNYLLFIVGDKDKRKNAWGSDRAVYSTHEGLNLTLSEKSIQKNPHKFTTYIKELLDKKQFEISMENNITAYLLYLPHDRKLPAGKFYFRYERLYFNIPCNILKEPIKLLGNLDEKTIEDIKENIKNNKNYIVEKYKNEIKQNFLIELTKYVEEKFTKKVKNFLKKHYPKFYDAHVNATTNQVNGGKRYHTKKRFSKKRSKSSKKRTHKRKKTRKSKR